MKDLSSTLAHAKAYPQDVAAQIAAAYACDREGTEEEAVLHYDAAWKLGIPDSDRGEFMLGYGSTLKNVGRLKESEAILKMAILEAPENKALPAFLALTQHAQGHHGEALATLLDILLSFSPQNHHLADYARALGEYRDQLQAR
jgi:Flp pilus assembly protein TadD